MRWDWLENEWISRGEGEDFGGNLWSPVPFYSLVEMPVRHRDRHYEPLWPCDQPGCASWSDNQNGPSGSLHFPYS